MVGKFKCASTTELVFWSPFPRFGSLIAVREGQIRIDDGADFLVPFPLVGSLIAVREDQRLISTTELVSWFLFLVGSLIAVREGQMRIDDGVGSCSLSSSAH